MGKTRQVPAIRQGTTTVSVALLVVSLLMVGCSRKGKTGMAEVREILRQARQAAEQSDREKFSLLELIAVAQAEAGDVKGALSIASAAGTDFSKARVLAEVAVRQAEMGNVPGARKTADSIGQLWAMDKSKALKAIAKAQATAGDAMAALETADGVHDTLARWPQRLQAAAPSVPQLGGLEFLPQVEKAATLGEIAGALAERGDSRGATQTFQRAVQAASAIQGRDRSVCLGQIAKAQAEAGDLKGALCTAEAMENASIVRGLVLPAVAMSLARAGNATGAIHLATTRGGPDAESILQGIAETQAESGDVQGALETAHMIKYKYAKASSLAQVALVQAKAGGRDAAVGTFEEALEIAEAFEEQTAAHVWHSKDELLGGIAAAQADARDIQGALETADRISRDRPRAGAFCHIAAAQADVGDIQGALKTANCISEELYRWGALRDIAMAQLRTGDLAAGRRTIKGLLSKANEFQLRLLAELQADAGDKEGALAWAKSERAARTRAWALLGVAQGMLERMRGRRVEPQALKEKSTRPSSAAGR